MPNLIKFPKNTPIRCNRGCATGPAPRAFEARRENAVCWRIQDMLGHPDCTHVDAHWVYRVDLFRHDLVIRDALSLTSGTIASLSGVRNYEEIEEIQEQFALFCCEHYLQFGQWQIAWAAFQESRT